ncbi:hypothetical protein GMJAKD_05215 [Candidatus Electrothrix aarhusensis]
MQVCSAFGAVRGRKDHGLCLIRQPEDDDIEERADKGTENKAVEKKEGFHVYCRCDVDRSFSGVKNVSLNQKPVPVIIPESTGGIPASFSMFNSNSSSFYV